jgi:tetratricopeptide (TPR) repeat protein
MGWTLFDYYEPMHRTLCQALLLMSVCLSAAHAQGVPAPQPTGTDKGDAGTTPVTEKRVTNSALSAELLYEILLGELNVQGGEPGAGYSLILNAARKNNDSRLYQRAVELALQSRSGEAALQAARAWRQAQPTSRAANRALLQILLALNRIDDALEPLKAELAMAGSEDLPKVIAAIPRSLLQASDKAKAAAIVEQAMAGYTGEARTAGPAWSAIGRMRLGSEDLPGALSAALQAQAAAPDAPEPAMLGLELLEAKQPKAEALVLRYLERKNPSAEIQMAYARVLTGLRRFNEAITRLQNLTRTDRELAQAWLLLGTLQLQEQQRDAAQSSLTVFLDLAKARKSGSPEEEQGHSRALAQAYLSLAQIAEDRKDYPAAEAWIARIDNAQALVGAQSRRASLLARQGKLPQALDLIRTLPEKDEADVRMKVMAEVELLRDNKQFQAAYDALVKAVNREPDDASLLYDQAMLAEKLARLDEMERLLRRVMQLKPDYHHAYNALGYSLAERNVRLTEAKQLIEKALASVPDDPFIQDSLGWVEFRMGNKTTALRILEKAYSTRPDAEISAHLGEVLWSLGMRSRAIAVWKEGHRLSPDNETLRETVKRLRASLGSDL